MNITTIHWQDSSFLRVMLGLLTVPILFIRKDILNRLKADIGSIFQLNKYTGLIVLWLSYVFLYFIEYNFRSPRPLYGDEATLWFNAAKNMLQGSVLQAHLTSYPGGGLHPFGIPYLSTIPGLLWGIKNEALIFFMPIFNIIAFTLILIRLRHQPWVFLFFYVACFVVCDYAGLLGALLFRLVYGEGWSAIYFFAMGAEIFRLARNGKIMDMRSWIGLCAVAGLAILTKKPVSYWGAIFVLTATVFYFKTGWSTRLLKGFLAGLSVFFLPMAAWEWVASKYGIKTVSAIHTFLSNGGVHYDVSILNWQAMMDWSHINGLVPYFLVGAFFLSFVGLRGINRIHLVPSLAMVLFVTAYYVLGFQSDWASSSVRYYMPQMLLTFFLAGIGLEDLMQKGAILSRRTYLFLSGAVGLILIGGMLML